MCSSLLLLNLLTALTPIFPIFSATQEDIITSCRGNTEPLHTNFGRLKYFSVHLLVLIKAFKICLQLSGYHFCFLNQLQTQKQGKLGFALLESLAPVLQTSLCRWTHSGETTKSLKCYSNPSTLIFLPFCDRDADLGGTEKFIGKIFQVTQKVRFSGVLTTRSCISNSVPLKSAD